MNARFTKGARVVRSGHGRTATWGDTPGTVTRRLSRSSVEVVWDGTHFGDEMELCELRLVEPAPEEVAQAICLPREGEGTMGHTMTTEFSPLGYVVRYWTPQGTRYTAYNDLGRRLCTCERERTAWQRIEAAARRRD